MIIPGDAVLLLGANHLSERTIMSRLAEKMPSVTISEAYVRHPLSSQGGIDVFLDEVSVARFDEYRTANPYRTATTSESRWDRFRVGTAVAAARGPRVLDAGCGEGDLTEALTKQIDGVFAFDISVSAAKLIRQRLPQVPVCVADAMNMPYKDDYFDTVIAANLFEHVESPCGLLRECWRVLKPGGLVVISTPSRYRTANFRRVITGRPVQFNHTLHVTEYTCGQVIELLRWCGFRLVRVESNLRCLTLPGTIAAYAMQFCARVLRSQTRFGDPTVYVAERIVE